jgi:hypothetical protein
LIFNISFPLDVLVTRVTVFLCIPGLFEESNFTLITLDSPGLIGVSLGYSGTVHPQLPEAFNIFKSESPELVNVKTVSTTSPSLISPKS